MTRQSSGQLTGAQSIEWKTVVSPLKGEEVNANTLYTENRVEVILELLKDGEIRIAAEDIYTWSEALP